MTTMAHKRTRAQILTDLTDLLWIAGRMTVVDDGYAEVHAEMNDRLDELGV